MIPGAQEVIRSLKGAALLARRDPSALGYFNLSIEGFWRSFAALLLVAPIFFIFAGLDFAADTTAERQDGVTPAADGRYASIAVLLIISWASFPLIMVPVARVLGLSHRYVTYIIVFNWTSVLAELILATPIALLYMGLFGVDTARGVYGIALLLVVVYRWYIAKTALETTGLNASAMVLLEFTLSIAISKYGGLLVG